MATSLYLITNSKLTGSETQKDWERIVYELNKMQMTTTSYLDANYKFIKEYGSWSYEIEPEEVIFLSNENFEGITSEGFVYPEKKVFPFNVSFNGPFHIQSTLYSNIGVIYTIYRYSLLYQIYSLDWFESFRNDLYRIVKIIGGTEVIYLADNACDKLSDYLECMAWANLPYEEIKEKMIQEFGPPVTNYSKINNKTINYKKINEFFLDDFTNINMGSKKTIAK